MRLAALAAALRRAAAAAAPREVAFSPAGLFLRAPVLPRAVDAADRVGFLRVAVFRRGRLVVWRADRPAFARAVLVFFAFARAVVAFFFALARAAVVAFFAVARAVVFFFRLGAAPPVRDRLEARALLRLLEPAGLRLRVEDVFRPLAV